MSAALQFLASVGVGQAADDATSTTTSNSANDGDSSIFTHARIHGRGGIYDFRRWHDALLPYPHADRERINDHSHHGLATTAYGAQIDIDTGRWRGLSFAGQLVYTSSFYGSYFDSTR